MGWRQGQSCTECAQSQAQCFPKRTLGTKHLVSLSTVTIIAKGCREKGAWERQAEVPRVPPCGVTDDTPSSPAVFSGGTWEVLFSWEACWRTRGLGFHWQLTTWAASAGTDQSSRLQKAGQVVRMDSIVCTVQASQPLLSVHGGNPLQVQAPRKGLMMGAAFQRRAGPGHGG